MQFIHAIDLANPFPCHNLSINGRLFSPNALASVDPGVMAVHQPLSEVSIVDLSNGQLPSSAVSPRAIGEIIRPGILRNNMQIANGFNEVELISAETKQDAIQCSDVELEFERVRRIVAPTATSRLSCIYLAERSQSSIDMLKVMLGRHVYILDVKIVFQLSLTKVDSAWFDSYFETQNPIDVSNYWLGIEKPGGGKWEYLLDGAIEVEDPLQLIHIRQHGAKFGS